MKKYAAGIDIGGTNTKIGIVSNNGDVCSRTALETGSYSTPSDFKKAIRSELITLTDAPKIKLCGIGIGAPNANIYSGSIEFAPNLPWKGIVKLNDGLDDLAPVLVTNDANAAAIGEKLFGAARDFSDFIVVTLGTGVGGGIFCDSKLLYGKYGFAGEIGHITAVPGGRKCNCGRKGCVEKYCSAGGIVTTALELIKNYKGRTSLEKYDADTLTTRVIYEKALQGDEAAVETFDITARYLASFFNDLVNIFSPEAIIISGGVAKSGDILLTPLEKYFRQELIEFYRDKNIRLLRSTLPGQDSAIIGAASLSLW
ncbi:MAG: ROK family protein [Spirochaetia bacterium]|jgi:glucokinase|nr:ROK family protein [Spirochaetia bacterium]